MKFSTANYLLSAGFTDSAVPVMFGSQDLTNSIPNTKNGYKCEIDGKLVFTLS
jgi:hypothetical protein